MRVRADAAEIAKLLQEPKLPDYPKAPLDAGFGAIIVVRVALDSEGQVEFATAALPPGGLSEAERAHYAKLVRAATAAAEKFRFEPYRISDIPTAVESTLAFRFDPAAGKVTLASDEKATRPLRREAAQTADPAPPSH